MFLANIRAPRTKVFEANRRYKLYSLFTKHYQKCVCQCLNNSTFLFAPISCLECLDRFLMLCNNYLTFVFTHSQKMSVERLRSTIKLINYGYGKAKTSTKIQRMLNRTKSKNEKWSLWSTTSLQRCTLTVNGSKKSMVWNYIYSYYLML